MAYDSTVASTTGVEPPVHNGPTTTGAFLTYDPKDIKVLDVDPYKALPVGEGKRDLGTA